MKTAPKVEDPQLKKFHYDQAERMLLLTFITRLAGNPGHQVKFQMPPTVDQALQIAVTVFEAESQEKGSAEFFRLPKLAIKAEETLVNHGRTMVGHSSVRRLALPQTRNTPGGSRVSDIPARLTQTAKESCFVSSVGNLDTFPETAFPINSLPEGTKDEIVTLKCWKVGQYLCCSCSSKHPSSGKLVTGGSHGSDFHRELPSNAVSKLVTVPLTLDHSTPTVAVEIQGAERILIVDSESSWSLPQPGVADVPFESTTFEPFGVTGDSLNVAWKQEGPFRMGRVTFRHSFLVCKLPTSADGILGLNFLTPRRARVDLGNFSLEVALHPDSDLLAPSLHESRWEECKRREGRGLITHVSISQNPSEASSAVLAKARNLLVRPN
jgi:hypothetical protein